MCVYIQPLVKIKERHCLCFHLYAVDTQLYKACRIEDLPSLVGSTSDCISDVKIWMNNNRLNLYDEKTEFMLRNCLRQVSTFNGRMVDSCKKKKKKEKPWCHP